MTLETALVIGINGLTGAVVFLFGWFVKSNAKMGKLLDQRDEERGKLQERLNRIEGLTGWLRNCPVPECPARDPAREAQDDGELSRETLSVARRRPKAKPQPEHPDQ